MEKSLVINNQVIMPVLGNTIQGILFARLKIPDNIVKIGSMGEIIDKNGKEIAIIKINFDERKVIITKEGKEIHTKGIYDILDNIYDKDSAGPFVGRDPGRLITIFGVPTNSNYYIENIGNRFGNSKVFNWKFRERRGFFRAADATLIVAKRVEYLVHFIGKKGNSSITIPVIEVRDYYSGENGRLISAVLDKREGFSSFPPKEILGIVPTEGGLQLICWEDKTFYQKEQLHSIYNTPVITFAKVFPVIEKNESSKVESNVKYDLNLHGLIAWQLSPSYTSLYIKEFFENTGSHKIKVNANLALPHDFLDSFYSNQDKEGDLYVHFQLSKE